MENQSEPQMASTTEEVPSPGGKNPVKMAFKGEIDKLKKYLDGHTNAIDTKYNCDCCEEKGDEMDLHLLLDRKDYIAIQKRRKASVLETIVKISATPIKKTASFFSNASQVENPDTWRATLLIVAARQNHPDIVEMLLNRGAKKNETCSFSLTALHYASFFGHVDVCRLLLDKDDLEVNACSDHGLTALHCAAAAGRLECVGLIMKRGNKDKIDVINKATSSLWHSKTSLHFAVENDNLQVVETLLSEKNLNVNAQDSKGFTALAMATKLGNLPMIALLVSHPRVKTNIPTNEKLLPANLAITDNNIPAFWLLMSGSVRDEVHQIAKKCSGNEAKLFNDIMNQMRNQCQQHENPREKYDISGDTFGLSLIINIEKFQTEEERFGSSLDLTAMKETLTCVGCQVIENHDEHFTDANIRDQIKDFKAKIAREKPPFIVVVIMTHGTDEGKLITHDGYLTDTEILDKFNGENCPTMVAKPKIFIFQACRGQREESEVSKPMRNRIDSVPFCDPEYAANYSDMLIAYSSVPGHVSYRYKETGSEFIQKICEVFQANVLTLEISQMMNLVMKEMSAYTNKEKNSKQTCCIEYRGFWKAFYFPEKLHFQYRLTLGKESVI